jgi:predicted component of type VI protein secretion system
MGWGKLWLMPDFGSDDYHRRIRDIQRAAGSAGKEIDQDEQIEHLQRETRELKLYIAGLLQLLVNKGTMVQTDIEELVRAVERAQQEADRLVETSPDLEAIAAAARGQGK